MEQPALNSGESLPRVKEKTGGTLLMAKQHPVVNLGVTKVTFLRHPV
jgi:hypothetical protein